MSIRNALAAVIAAGFAWFAPYGAAAQAGGSENPPLKGLFQDNFTLLNPPAPAPQTAFTDAAGQARRLGDFAGRVVLLNFWATWCAPCVRELPTMDRLQARLGGEGLAVVAVSWDRGGLAVVEPFLAELGIEHLDIYLDTPGRTGPEFGVRGLPTTFLIDRQGRMVGGMEGPAEWDSPEAEALIRHYLARGG
ncbi:MAG: TlpA family protein disulfide reductase [Rhodospirillales bacterium]|nr:TlpA family protein disulfide reductase [Rhodospirillales bacterium]